MATMQAWVFKKAGNPSEVLQLENAWPKPTPSGSKVLVKVHAVSLNPVGWKTMSQFPMSLMSKKPCVPEADVAGVVAETSGEFAEGDEVFGIIPYDGILKSGAGALAEFALVESALLARKPKNLSFEEACSFPLAGLTAWQALTVEGGLKEGDGKRVFINGGSGGVGAYAVQIAKAYGAYVVTTSSPSSDSLVKSLGADEMIDYRSVDLPKHMTETFGRSESTKFDITFDTVGVQSVYAAAPGYLKRTGRYVDVAGPHLDGSILSVLSAAVDLSSRFLLPTWLGGKVQYRFFMLQPSKVPKLKEAADFFAKGTFKPIVDQTFAFTDVHKAYERSMSGRAKGKVVVKVA